jgi:hypothetical protein
MEHSFVFFVFFFLGYLLVQVHNSMRLILAIEVDYAWAGRYFVGRHGSPLLTPYAALSTRIGSEMFAHQCSVWFKQGS